MAEQFANNASTTLNGAHNNSTTSFVVTDGSVFPSTGNYRIICGTEIMLVTARSTNTLTVTRGYESTTAASHTSGDSVSLIFTKGSLDQFLADYEQTGVRASRPSAPRKGTRYTATDLLARWYYNGSSWDLLWPAYVPNARKWDVTGWTAQNQSTATFTDKTGILEVTTMPINNNAVRGYSKSLPSTPYKATWIIGANPYAPPSATFFTGHRENSSGKIRAMVRAANGGGIVAVENWNNYNSFGSVSLGTQSSFTARVQWQRVENDGTNIMFWTSSDGKNYTKIFSEAKTTGWSTAADQIFFGFYNGTQYATGVTGAHILLGYWEE